MLEFQGKSYIDINGPAQIGRSVLHERLVDNDSCCWNAN